MQRVIPVLLVLLGLFFACTGSDTGNPFAGTDTGNPNVLSGIVRDSSGQAVPMCSVWVQRHPSALSSAHLAKTSATADSAQVLHLLITDSSGEFELTGLPTGSYTVTAVAKSISKGAQTTISLGRQDTLKNIFPTSLQPLTALLVTLPKTWVGHSVTVPQTGWSFTLDKPSFVLPPLPSGTYTLQPDLPSTPAQTIQVPPVQSVSNSGFYNVALVGQQTWLGQNSYFALEGSACHPLDTSSDCSQYGRFYTYSQALQACPEGWALPTVEDWNTLQLQAGGFMAATQLKSTTRWATVNGLDTFRFAVFPVGTLSEPTLGTHAYFWLQETNNTYQALHFEDTTSLVSLIEVDPTLALSVRCVLIQ